MWTCDTDKQDVTGFIKIVNIRCFDLHENETEQLYEHLDFTPEVLIRLYRGVRGTPR